MNSITAYYIILFGNCQMKPDYKEIRRNIKEFRGLETDIMNKVLILTNSIKGLYCFRKELIEELMKEGFEVSISSPGDSKNSYFKELGCNLTDTSIDRRGTNPIKDLKLFTDYIKIIAEIKPNIVLTYTIKPNVYGGLACRLLRVPYIANITGLGTSIERKGIISAISLMLYKIGLKDASCIFFQNSANKDFFIKNGIVDDRKAREIPGSGVNLQDHALEEYPGEDENIRFLFIGRIMKSKGIEELFEAARIIKEIYPSVEFHLIGEKEENYEKIINDLENRQIIQYHGYQENIHGFIKRSHATINPSYHEGMSNVLLESASAGRPVLASNVPGCKETFDEGISGFGFTVKNVDSLVEAIIKFIQLPYEDKKKMGLAGRRKMEKEFDRNLVLKAYLEQIKSILKEN